MQSQIMFEWITLRHRIFFISWWQVRASYTTSIHTAMITTYGHPFIILHLLPNNQLQGTTKHIETTSSDIQSCYDFYYPLTYYFPKLNLWLSSLHTLIHIWPSHTLKIWDIIFCYGWKYLSEWLKSNTSLYKTLSCPHIYQYCECLTIKYYTSVTKATKIWPENLSFRVFLKLMC